MKLLDAAQIIQDTPMTFEEIYARNGERILNLAYRMTGRRTVAQDLTQDVFIKVFEKIDTFREEARLSSWIYRIAMNHIINYIKREKKMSLFGLLTGENEDDRFDGQITVWEDELPERADSIMEERQRETLIRKLIDELPAKYKLPLVLYRYEDMGYQQIAEQLGLSLSAVESRIHRGRKKLKEKLQPWMDAL